MSKTNPIRIFVSHAWEQHDEYHRVFEYLESASNFYYENSSSLDAPEGNKEDLKEALREQIKSAEAVIVLSILYSDHRDWIDFEIHAAKAFDKPLIALEPFGTGDPVPKEIRDMADEVLEWNERHLVDALRRLARGEETSRWEVIDFP